MPIEIRELAIDTKIDTLTPPQPPQVMSAQALAALKQQILAECLRTIQTHTAHSAFDR